MFGILCVGDSITHGRGESPSFGWAGRLKENFEKRDYYNVLYSLGVPGNNTKDLLKRFETEVSSRTIIKREGDKFLIILAIGINDTKGINMPENIEISKEEFTNNLKQLMNLSKKHASEVVIISLMPVDETQVFPYQNTYFSNKTIREYNEILKINAEEKKFHYIDLFNKFIKLDYKKLLQDGLHPNSEGYDKMYELILEDLEKLKIL